MLAESARVGIEVLSPVPVVPDAYPKPGLCFDPYLALVPRSISELEGANSFVSVLLCQRDLLLSGPLIQDWVDFAIARHRNRMLARKPPLPCKTT